MKNNPMITTTLAAGSVASPYYIDVAIREKLCQKVCAENAPVFAPVFSVVGTRQVAEGQYMVTLNVQGIISYTPCSGGCTARTMSVNENFQVPVAADAEPTEVSVSAGATVNTIDSEPCKKCSEWMVSRTPISLTVTEPAP